MKKSLFFLLAAIVALLPSCSKNGGYDGSLEEVFRQIPKDSKMVVVINYKAIHDILTSSKDYTLQELVEDAMGRKEAEKVLAFIGEDSPIDSEAPTVLFEKDDTAVLTFFVTDEKKTAKLFDDELDLSLKEKNGYWSDEDDRCFMMDNQVWFVLNYRSDFTANEIKKMKDQDVEKSFASLDVAKRLSESKSAYAAIVNLDEMGEMDRDIAQFMLAMNAVFDDPQYIEAYMDFKEGEIKCNASVLNRKCQPATCAIHPVKISQEDLKGFAGKGSFFGAIGLDPNIVNQIINKLQSFSGSFSGDRDFDEQIKSIARTIDGTVVVSCDFSPTKTKTYNEEWDYYETNDPTYTVMVPFKSASDASEAYAWLSHFFNSEYEVFYIKAAENKLYISNAMTSDGASVSSVADMFNDACVGIAALNQGIAEFEMFAKYIRAGSLVWKTKDKGLSLELTIEMKEGQNALITICEVAKMIRKAS